MKAKSIITLPFTIILFFFFLTILLIIPFIISSAFSALGFSPLTAIMIFLAALIGSAVNIPVYSFKTRRPVKVTKPNFSLGFLYPEVKKEYRMMKTTVALNLGGAVIPILLSVYLFYTHPDLWLNFLIGIAVVTAISYKLARPVQGLGITMPLFIPPLLAAIVAFILPSGPNTVIAFVSGVMGVLIGADLLNLSKTAGYGSRMLSIGGAGTFDGIFLTGIVSVLLAAL
ncbi:MAG: DUF1614 domain-containing protein [Thermoplasmatota archaeon]